jgi:hypothetical protein
MSGGQGHLTPSPESFFLTSLDGEFDADGEFHAWSSTPDIGWQSNAPPGIGSRVRRAVAFLLALAVVLGVLLAVAQRTSGVSVSEWGKVKSFTGILRSQPYPHLLVPRPGVSSTPTPFSSYYLVKPFRFGLDSETVSRLDGKAVSLKGTLILKANPATYGRHEPR